MRSCFFPLCKQLLPLPPPFFSLPPPLAWSSCASSFARSGTGGRSGCPENSRQGLSSAGVCVCPSSQAVSVLLPPLDQTSITVSRSWEWGAFGPSPTGCLKSKGQQVKSPSLDCELIYKCESFNQAELKDPPPHTQRFKEILVLSSASPCLPCGRTILRGGPLGWDSPLPGGGSMGVCQQLV